MRRALADFERAQLRSGFPMAFVAAPMGLSAPGRLELRDWLPSAGGFAATQIALHEWLGRLAGA
jgi:hypothetical protein